MSSIPDMTLDDYPELADWPTAPKTIEAIRAIAENHACRLIDGVLVDAWTARVISVVYEAISPQHQEHLMSLPIDKIGHVAWKLVK